MSADLVLRPARPDDAPRLHELHTASVRALCSGHYAADVIEGWLLNRAPDGCLAATLRHAVALARRGHGGPIRLEATLNARDFYARAGFREIQRSTVTRNRVDIPVIVMEMI